MHYPHTHTHTHNTTQHNTHCSLYTCIFCVAATVPPTIAEATNDTVDSNPMLTAGQVLTLTCTALGIPCPQIDWYNTGQTYCQQLSSTDQQDWDWWFYPGLNAGHLISNCGWFWDLRVPGGKWWWEHLSTVPSVCHSCNPDIWYLHPLLWDYSAI